MPQFSASRYLYTAWFRDELARTDDENYEWPACFLVEACTPSDAQSWGDHLSASFSRRRGTERFLRSHVELAEEAMEGVPVVQEGHEATDAEIGW